jgi:pectate disaccharide-lyase
MRIAFLLIFFLAGPRLPGATYYVSPGGTDSNPGSANAPFRTLMRGAQVAAGGDTVIALNGTYGHENAVTGGDNSDSNASPVVLSRSGTPAAWITFKAQHRWGAILDCQMTCDAYFDLADSSYVVIQGFVITHGYREGIHSNGAAHHIVIRGNRIEYIANRQTSVIYGLDGMYTSPNCHDFIVDSNAFHDIGRTNASLLDHGLYLRGRNFTVTNNLFYNLTRGWGIQMADGLTNVLIANNTFGFVNPSAGGQIMMWNAQTQLTIRNNIFCGPQTAAIAQVDSSAGACAIDHNLVSGTAPVIEHPGGCRIGSNLMKVDPLFVNAAAPVYDFRPSADSPVAHAGVQVAGVVVDFDGVPRPSTGGIAIGALQPVALNAHNAPAKPLHQR